MSDKLINFQKAIGVRFDDPALLKQALTHRSYLNEAKQELESNERLEFLGDAVLELLVSDYLYKTYPDLPEGKLTNLRSAAVKTTTLAEVSRELKLGERLYLSKGEERSGGRKNESLLADVFEALLGAIYLNQGIETARRFVNRQITPLIPEIIRNKAYLDFKSHLQTVIQEDEKITPTYEVIKDIGPDHDKTFTVVCKAGERVLAEGKGKSKQAAEQAAAENALAKLERT